MSATFVLGGALLCASTTNAQTIRPLRAEFHGNANGRVELVNDGVRPLVATIQARSFTVSTDGTVMERPLDASVSLKLSEMSVRIPPKQSRFVFYDARSSNATDWFMLYAAFTGYATADAGPRVAVQLELPHFVYLLPKVTEGGLRVNARVHEFDAVKHEIVLELQNDSASFARVVDLVVRDGDRMAHGEGFAFFPSSTRRLTVPWDGGTPPSSVVMMLRAGRIECPIVSGP